MVRRVLLAAALAASSACTKGATEVLISITGDGWAIDHLASFDFTIKAGHGPLSPVASGSECASWPRVFALIPEDDDPTRIFELELVGRDHFGGELARMIVTGGYEEERIGTLPVVFGERCRATSCLIDRRGQPLHPIHTLEREIRPPSLSILFPPQGAIAHGRYMTLTASATGIDEARIGTTRVEPEGCGVFRAALELMPGEAELSTEVIGDRITSASRKLQVIADPPHGGPYDLLLNGGSAIVTRTTDIGELDLATGRITTLASWTRDQVFATRLAATGTTGSIYALSLDHLYEVRLSSARVIASDLEAATAMAVDPPRNRVIIAQNVGAVFEGRGPIMPELRALDPRTGAHEVFWRPPPPLDAQRIEDLARVGDLLYLAFSNGVLLELDLTTLADRTISCPPRQARYLAWDATRRTLIVVDTAGRRLFELDPATQTCRHLPELEPALVGPTRVALSDRTAWVADVNLGTLVGIDLDTGARAIVPRLSAGRGPPIASPWGCAWDEAHRRVLMLSRTSPPALLGVRARDGYRTLISGEGRGSGPPLAILDSIAVNRAGDRALITQSFPAAILEVDLRTGDRRLISEPADPHFIIYAEDEGFAYLVDRAERAVLVVDLITGARRPLSGTPLSEPHGLALDQKRNRLLVAEHNPGGIVEINLENGTGQQFEASGEGPYALSIAPGSDRMLIRGGGTILELDLETHALERRTGHELGGLLPDHDWGMCVDHKRGIAYLTDILLHALFAVELATGASVLMSR